MRNFELYPQGQSNEQFSLRPRLPEIHESTEVEKINYPHTEYVPEDFPVNVDKLKLRHLFELSPEDTVVIVGDKIVYEGGDVSCEFIDGLRVRGTRPTPYGDGFLQVLSFCEDGRTIAYTTNRDKGRLFIEQSKSGPTC